MDPEHQDLRPLHSRRLDRLEPDIWDCWDEHGFYAEKCKEPYELIILWATRYAESDICNGGMHQFFGNPTGRVAAEAVIGFRLLGIDGCAEAIEAAMRFFGDPYPRDEVRRNEMLAAVPGYPKPPRAVWDPFTDLDHRFYATLESQEDWFNRAANAFASRY